MPANLTPDYHRAEERLRQAKTVEEKIDALEEMLRVVPKHKGTDGLQADLKGRIAKLRKQPPSKAGKATHSHLIPHEGAGQVALVGPANTGKSSLVASLTHAKPEVAAYPFTTREPTPGMMRFEDIAFQLIDLPPLGEEHVEPWVFDIVRGADLLWIVVAVENAVDGLELTRRILAAKGIEVEPRPVEGHRVKRALVVATGLDRDGGDDDLAIVDELLQGGWPLVGVSCTTGRGLPELARATFEALGIVRVYTKQPGKPADREAPFTLPRGATVGDLAARVHKELAASMKHARIWGPSAFDGQSVHADHVLAEGDVVEIHT
jgi:ribosome-interacting GTPase 1